MSRIIKFRAWDTTRNRFTNAFDLFYAHEELMDGPDGQTYPRDGMIVEQFTGLLDKNGREIFEQDVLRPMRSEIGEDNRTVVWEGAAFCMRLSVCGVSAGLLVFGQDYEVIGNIHENPDLSASEKDQGGTR